MGNNEDKKRVLVTGGAGFLGSHLCDRLLKDGNYVICLDNFYTGHSINIEHMISNKNFKLLEHDIINPIKINVDEIYNLACPASPIHYQHDPIYTLKTSIFGTPTCFARSTCSRVCGIAPSVAATTSTAPSIWAAPVIMFLM